MTTHLAASRFARVLHGQLGSRGLRLTRNSGNAPDTPEITFHAQWEPRAQQDGYSFRDSLQQFVLNTYLESVSHAATNPKKKMWISCSLILLSQAQHQESKEKENGKLCRQWKGSRLGLYMCRRRNRKSFPKQLPNHNRLPTHPQAYALSFLAFRALPVLSHPS